MVTVEDLNKLNRSFWVEQEREAERLQTVPLILGQVLEVLAGEVSRGVPPRSRTAWGEALRKADAFRNQVLAYQGRLGGQARQLDPLQERIVEIVRAAPNITCDGLLSCLRDEAPGLVVGDIEEEKIWFNGRDGSLKSAPLSGLKDRLSRAKKRIGLALTGTR